MIACCLNQIQQAGIHHSLNPDQYRGLFGSDGPKYARDVDEIITYGTTGCVAAFIAEAIQVLTFDIHLLHVPFYPCMCCIV